MAKREKNPASDKTGNDTGVSLLVLGHGKGRKSLKHRGNMYSRCKLDSGNRPYIYDVSISMIRIA